MSADSSKILFDRFEITETLKKDQHTTVYLANHIYLGKKIILKTLSTFELPDKTFLDRFKREAKILAQLDHPNIIKVLDFGTAENSFYISFEYFESHNLRITIKEDSLSDSEKVNLIIQLYKALDAAHQRSIIHRDIKPENILVNSKLELKIADFGLALIRDENVLTQKTSIVGTPGYMSPEQIRGENLTPQTDLFSSGIVIYELFTGENPLIGNDISETINNILNFKLEKDFNQISSLPLNIQSALHELLRKNFSKRTKTALEALNYFIPQGKLIEEQIVQRIEKKSNKRFYYWSVAVILILIAGFFISKSLLPTDNSSGANNEILQNITDSPEKIDSSKIVVNEEIAANKDNNVKIPEIITDIKPEDNSIDEIKPQLIPADGKLFVEVSPWADVFINDKKIGTTPLGGIIDLETGKYELRLMHPEFPSYSDSIEIFEGELNTIKINFYEEVGYLDCKIFPWGEIYIDGIYKNTTPLRKPMVLMPGEYNLKITNPGYLKEIEEIVIVKAKETIVLKYNFEELARSQ